MNRFPDDLNTLLSVLRDCRDNKITIDPIRQRILFEALDRLEISAHELDAMLDMQTVISAGSDDDPYSLYNSLTGLCDALLPVEEGIEKLDVRKIRNNLIRCTAIAASTGYRLQMAEAMLANQTKAAINMSQDSNGKVVSLSEYRS